MLDYKKLRKEFTKVLNSYTDEEFFEWFEMDKQRMSLVDNPRMPVGKLNGATHNSAKVNGTPHNTAKSKGVPVKKTKRSRATAKT